MQIRSTRIVAMSLAVLAVGLLLAACGSGDDDDAGEGGLTISGVWSRPVELLNELDGMDHDGGDTDNSDIQAGMTLFADNGCTACHGDDASGTDIAPALVGLTMEQIKDQVREPSGTMPPFSAEQISDNELDQIAVYLMSLDGDSHEHDAGSDGMGAVNGVVYLTIENAGDEDDRLISASSDVATAVELHDVNMVDGVMQMRQVEAGIEIPAGETTELKPQGLHIMLIGLNQSLEVGDMIEVELEFEDAGSMTIESEVREP